jgi:hypothetical protein
MNIRLSDYIKAIFVIMITWYFIYCLRSLENFHIVTIVNLIIHEAGHSILLFFGQFIQVLGGSLFQVFVPLIFAVYFFIREDIYSSGIILLWVGESVIEVSRYASDATLMQLPLLGGDNVIHDWNWLLSYTNLLQHTSLIASIIFTVGVLIMIGGFMVAFGSIVRRVYRRGINI